jgi:hypothetical protein
MLNGVDFEQEDSFMETIKERLLRERELLEKKIEDKRLKIKNYRDTTPQKKNKTVANKFNEAKEYEKTLESIGKDVLHIVQLKEEQNNTWHLFSDIEILKRRIDTMNTNKFLEYQIREKVTLILNY